MCTESSINLKSNSILDQIMQNYVYLRYSSNYRKFGMVGMQISQVWNARVCFSIILLYMLLDVS